VIGLAFKKKNIKKGIERAVLSDILPYETPPTFSNRQFYDFLVKNNIRINGTKITFENHDPTLKTITKLLFGFCKDNLKKNTIPFKYKISHKENDFRELTIIHPKHQLAVIDFYKKYKELILYYCNVSPFSIRKPVSISKYSYYRGPEYFKSLAYEHDSNSIEEHGKEYEYFSSFFAYKDYSNIYKFYESYKYQRCEKKFEKLFKFDISRCFDSIYSHSISWALINKECVKDYIKDSKKTFGGQFDSLMQRLNHGETNGIVIGPEFSRLFAEIILQKIDLNVFQSLKISGDNIVYKTDYEIFRYIDDYFVFYNDEQVKNKILNEYKNQLINYKLCLNDSKCLLIERPIITGITIAKLSISDLVKNSFPSISSNQEKLNKKYSIYVSANKINTKFKKIIKETNVTYKDIMNYTLACIDRKTIELIDCYCDIEDGKDKEEMTKTLLVLLDFCFFLYNSFPRANATIKLCLILYKIIKFAKIKGNLNSDDKHKLYKKIYDEIFLVIKKNQYNKYAEIETLYLLIALKELGKHYRLTQDKLAEFIGIDLKNSKNSADLSYFTITVLLFYIGNIKRYERLKKVLKEIISRKFDKITKDKMIKVTELTLLLFDIIACPYLDISFKKEILKNYDIEEDNKNNCVVQKIIDGKYCWFTIWEKFDFGKTLETKNIIEGYQS